MEENAVAAVRSALARQGLQCLKIETLSPQGFGKKTGRCTFRIEATNGTLLKARCLESIEEAVRLVEVRSRVSPSFSPVLARHGSVLLEPWIAGDQLSLTLAAARAEEMGSLLGCLHATDLGVKQDCISTQERRERAAGQLATLAQSRVLSTDLSENLRAELHRCDPIQAPSVLVHMDYCPENLVVDPGGSLHVIDNEWLRIDAAGADLGRTYSRWLMTDDAWKRFMDGYSKTAPAHPGPLRFWQIVMAAAGAIVRLRKSAEELAEPLTRLRELAGAATPR